MGSVESGLGEKKAKACYTRFALSDLVVSGGLPFPNGKFSLAQIPPSPYSVTTSGWSSVIQQITELVPAGNEPSGEQVACGSSGLRAFPL